MDKIRCAWANASEQDAIYHDNEWGVPSTDDKYLFEILILETMQAGLSWHTILLKRENFRVAFDDFDYSKIAEYSDKKIDLLMQNSGIIRHRKKLESLIKNAKAFINIQSEFGSFYKYIWGFSGNKTIKNNMMVLSKTPLSDSISLDMKKRGFVFVGSTTIYAYLQAIGIVNDHAKDCFLSC